MKFVFLNVKLLAAAGCIGWLLTRVGSPEGAAYVTGGLFAIIGIALAELMKRMNFRPYTITIGVNYRKIFEELEFLGQEPGRYSATVEALRDAEYQFTAVSPSLLATSVSGQFVRDLTIFETPLHDYISFPVDESNFRSEPIFHTNRKGDSYELVLRVEEYWFASKPPNFVKGRWAGGGYDYLLLATLPCWYLPDHILWWHSPIKLFELTERKKKKALDKIRRAGWTVNADQPELLHDEYFHVSMRLL